MYNRLFVFLGIHKFEEWRMQNIKQILISVQISKAYTLLIRLELK